MQPPPDEIVALEEAAFAAWPAAEVVPRAGWRLRRTGGGLTRRGNSVWPGGPAPPGELDAALEAVRAFYAEHGLPARFQLTPVAAPAGLDGALAERGYEIEAPVEVQVARAREVIERVRERGALCESRASPDWLEVAGWRSRFGVSAEARAGFLGFLGRIGERAVFALARAEGEPVAAGLGVLDGARLGVFAMFTLPEARRRGGGRAVLAALARHALVRGATLLYLQVERDNAAALQLYGGAGFRPAYRYHYRTSK